jgi:hypothetical protein
MQVQGQDDESQVADRRYFSTALMAHIDGVERGETPSELLEAIVQSRMPIVTDHSETVRQKARRAALGNAPRMRRADHSRNVRHLTGRGRTRLSLKAPPLAEAK